MMHRSAGFAVAATRPVLVASSTCLIAAKATCGWRQHLEGASHPSVGLLAEVSGSSSRSFAKTSFLVHRDRLATGTLKCGGQLRQMFGVNCTGHIDRIAFQSR